MACARAHIEGSDAGDPGCGFMALALAADGEGPRDPMISAMTRLCKAASAPAKAAVFMNRPLTPRRVLYHRASALSVASLQHAVEKHHRFRSAFGRRLPGAGGRRVRE